MTRQSIMTYLIRVFCTVVASSPAVLAALLSEYFTGMEVGIGVAAVVALPTGYYINEVEQFFEKDQTVKPE